ncbi:phosphatidate cytidylyltransferase [Synergistales bacterium]|nr:phosphatidate cytidylyltransferase [Synergistales bacterium]
MKLALIAGEGALPEIIAERLIARGDPPLVYLMRGDISAFTEKGLEARPLLRADIADTLREIAARGARRVMFAGVVPKTLMYRDDMMDDAARGLLASLASRDDHSLLGAIVSLVERAGFEVIGYDDILSDLFAAEGHIAGREPTEAEMDDVRFGADIAGQIAQLSFGQSVVVSARAVVAVEAMEGTDAAVLRAGELSRSGVLVKMMKRGQDIRCDIPVVGAKTLRVMAKSRVSCLALQAGAALILRPEEFGETAEKENIAVVGVRRESDCVV